MNIPLYTDRGRTIVGFTTIDDEDAKLVQRLRWCMTRGKRTNYAIHFEGKTAFLMHRLLLGLDDPELQVDHIDGYGLNNRRSNLRVVTRGQNQQNRKKHCTRFTSPERGVSWIRRHQRWLAYLKVNGKAVLSKEFKTHDEAVTAVRNARAVFHPFSSMNRV